MEGGRHAAGCLASCELIPKALEPLAEMHFLWVYEYFQPELVNLVQDHVFEVIQQLKERGVYTEQEAEEVYSLRKKGEKQCAEKSVSSLQEKGRQAMMALWEILSQLPASNDQPSALKVILTELHTEAPILLKEIYLHREGYHLSRDLKGCQAEMTRWVTEWTSRFDQHKVPWGRKARRAVKLEERYTELIMVTAHRLGGSRYNEMMDTANIHESLSSQAAGGLGSSRPMRVEHLFRRTYYGPRPGPAPLVVVVSGVPGIGKTTMVQKLLHDWAAGKVCRQFSFVFHFQFRELNLLEGEHSLVGLIVARHPFLEGSVHQVLRQPAQVLFVFDGLDESREELDFDARCRDPEGLHSVPAIVAGLVSRELLRGCSVLVTSRPTALKTLERADTQGHAEVLGFFPQQRRRYFEKFYGQRAEGLRVYRHVRGHGVLYTLCFNPSYCWILCSALEGQFARRGGEAERRPPPRTITQLFGVFLANLLTNHARQTPHKKRAILRVGRMAYAGVKRRRLVFYQPDLREHGLGSSPFLSGFLTEFLERDAGSGQPAFSFLHLTVQEFLAALHFFLGGQPGELRQALAEVSACPDGRYEIFARFLSGLANPANMHTLDGPLGGLPRRPCSLILDWLLDWTQGAAKRGDKRALLQALHRLFEAQQKVLVQRTLGPGATLDLSAHHLNPVDCSALAYALECLDRAECLDTSSAIAQPEGLDQLVPHLSKCKEIRLDNNNLGDVGMQKLCAELRKPGGLFTTLQVCGNQLTVKSCEELVTVLRVNPQFTNLELGNNSGLGDSGMETLCTELQKTACQLEKLGLSNSRLTSASGPILAQAVRGSWTLTHLDLNDNSLKDAGLSQLCRVLEDPRCRIESLKLESNDLTKGCCDDLASALAQNQTVKELNLSFNRLEDVGVEKLLKKMGSRTCKLHTLRLSSTTLTERSGITLGAALRDNPALRNLDLSSNDLKDEGARLIFQALEESHSQIEKLWLQDVSLTHASCEAFASFLRTNRNLTTLHLKENPIGDEGLRLLSAGLGRSACQLQTLRLDTAELGDVGVQDLIRVLIGRHSITELTLPYNSIGDASIDALSHFVKTSPSLKEIRLRRNKFSPGGCDQLKRLGRAGLILSVGD